LGAERNLEDNYRLEPIYHITCKILVRVKNGKTFTKRGNVNKNLLNGVISVKNVKLGGKNWNSLFRKRSFVALAFARDIVLDVFWASIPLEPCVLGEPD
jgi:hypothetical protein